MSVKRKLLGISNSVAKSIAYKIIESVLGLDEQIRLTCRKGKLAIFAASTAIAHYICQQYQVQQVGKIDQVTEQLYAITTERRLAHPAVIAIVQATAEIFSANQLNLKVL